MKTCTVEIKHGDCGEVLREYADDTFDLIVTSPPYADKRKNTYGGVGPDKYVDWFLPLSAISAGSEADRHFRFKH